jgi:hypothetical protein
MSEVGFGRGYETNTYSEDVAPGMRRLAAFVFWTGGGFKGDVSEGGPRAGPPGVVKVSIPQSTRSKILMPLKVLLFGPLLPLAWVADVILNIRRSRGRKANPFKPSPMSPAVRAARETARYADGVLTIGTRTIPVPKHATLVVFVEDDPSQSDGIDTVTHRIATDPYPTRKGIDPADIERIRTTKDPQFMMQLAMKSSEERMRGEGQMFRAIHTDPVCREFMRRVGGGAW